MQTHTQTNPVTMGAVQAAAHRLSGVVSRTPVERHDRLSERYGADIYLKREDLQLVRSYKLRGAYHKISGLTVAEQERGIVCASAGNHAQGVAFTCAKLGVRGTIFMPQTTPRQKVDQVLRHGGTMVAIELVGDTFDAAKLQAMAFATAHQRAFIHPFDDASVIAGQGTVVLEVLQDLPVSPDWVIAPIGGGGLAAGSATVLQTLSPQTKLIAVEPAGAPSMTEALRKGEVVNLDQINPLVDGAAVKAVGRLNFEICQHAFDQILRVEEGAVCKQVLDLYEQDAIVAEPAGALSIAALDQLADSIKGKTVVCIVSGGNNDLLRLPEFRERAMLWEGRRHYFMVRFPQRPGALKEFVNEVLAPGDDIIRFEYIRKHHRADGPALVGIEQSGKQCSEGLQRRMAEHHFQAEYLNHKPDLLSHLL